MDTEPFVDLLEVLLHRRRSDPERRADLCVRVARGDLREDLELAPGETVDPGVMLAEKQQEHPRRASGAHRQTAAVSNCGDGTVTCAQRGEKLFGQTTVHLVEVRAQ